MKFSKQLILLSTLVASMTIPAISSATNGYFLIGFGAKSRSMGGTGVANNTGGMAAAFNPASMIDSGTQFDVGAELFSPPRSVTHQSGILGYTDEKSHRNLFMIPSMGGTYQVNKDTAVGFAFIGAGLKTQYDQDANSNSCKKVLGGQIPGYTSCPPTFFDPNITTKPTNQVGVELLQMQFIPSVAFRANKHNTFGVSMVLAMQFFRSQGLGAFSDLGFTQSPGNLTDEGFDHAYGGGFRLGWLGNFYHNKLKLGANYSSRVWMDNFQRYSNLFAEHGGFDIPENYALGAAFNVSPALTVAFDVQWIRYSDIKSIGNPGPAVDQAVTGNLFPLCPGADKSTCKLGGVNGLGFGWTNQTAYKLGVDWAYNEKINLRVGYNYAKSPIPNSQVLFNMLAPATPEQHFTFGGGYKFSEAMVLDVNVMIVPVHTIKGPTAFGPGGAPVQGSNASIAMGQYSVGGMLKFKF